MGYRSWWRKRRYQHTWARLERITLAALDEAPDAVMLTGDLCHIGLREEMRQVRPWLQELSRAVPVLLAPGNHDLYRDDSWASMADEWGALPIWGDAGFDAPWPHRLSLADGDLVALNSAFSAPWYAATGRLGREQLARLQRWLADGEARPWLLGVHHPPAPGIASRRKALLDAPALLQVLTQRQPTCVLHGHQHRSLANEAAGVPVVGTASASSERSDAPGGYSVITVDGSGECAVRRHAQGADSPALDPQAAR